jgi:hypothetical protein
LTSAVKPLGFTQLEHGVSDHEDLAIHSAHPVVWVVRYGKGDSGDRE